ncbi:unnamed protein product [Toxocara canis]|uniref:Uncharacterized protein n=1 Tax=Toxocara canis TaxID=6265 RepID=A0A183VCE2_TOXCA|nr:unnamed protein product [Toxocara canis]
MATDTPPTLSRMRIQKHTVADAQSDPKTTAADGSTGGCPLIALRSWFFFFTKHTLMSKTALQSSAGWHN